MICPSCGTTVVYEGSFCAKCGARLPQAAPPPPPPVPSDLTAAPPPPPPAWAQTPPPPPPPAATIPTPPPAPAPAWAQTPPPPPPPAAFGVAQPGWAQTPPPPPPRPAQPGAYYGAPAGVAGVPAASAGSGLVLPGLLAFAGGVVAVATAWLPWLTGRGSLSDSSLWLKPIDVTSGEGGLANGYYLIAAGALAAACGLILLLRLAPALSKGLGLGALAGGAGVMVVETAAYLKMNDVVTATRPLSDLGIDAGVAVGWGIYVGIAAAAFAVVGGLMALLARPAPVASPARPSPVLPALVAMVIVALAAGGVYAASQKPSGAGPNGLPSGGPTFALGLPTVSPTGPDLTPAPTPAATPVSALTDGYSSPDFAIEQYVTDQSSSFIYGGDCTSPTEGANFCSIVVDKLNGGNVYAVGPIASEPQALLLLRAVDGRWYVIADASPAEPYPSAWNVTP
jgi:hypothetical protein